MRIFKNLLVALVILWGLLALIVRSATPFIADYREQLVGLLSGQLGVPVSVDQIGARWYGIAPLLELRGLHIGKPGEALEIDRLYIDLALGELLTGSPLDALRLTIDGMQLTVVRADTGQLHLEGVGPIGQNPEQTRTVLPLPSGLRLLNTRVVWIDRKAGKPPFTIDEVDIVLDREGTLLDLRARLQTASGNADLSARLDGFLTTHEWDGETYIKVDNLDVADLFARYLPKEYGLYGLQLDLESWGLWRDAAPAQAQGSFQLRDLRLRPATRDAVPLNLVRAGAEFSVQRQQDGMQLGLKDLLLAFRGRLWPVGDLAVAVSERPEGGRRIRVAADYLRIDDLARTLRVRMPWPELQDPIERLRPRGELRDFRLSLDLAPDQPEWRVQSRFAEVATSPWGDIPGVENLSGRVHGQQDHLVLQFGSEDATVRFSELFRDPLKLLRLDGRVDLMRDSDRWQVITERLVADTPDIDTRTRMALEYRPDHPLFLDLQTDFSDGDASHALRYYPTSIMSESVVAWLDAAIKSGRVPAGTALVHGTLDEFPFEDPSSGIFQVVFDTRDLELDYLQGWPKLEHLDAHVRFHGNQLDIDLESASIYDSAVTASHGHIDSLNPAGPLYVKGQVHGPLQNVLRLLQEDALRDDFGDIVAPMRAKGDSVLNMAFAIPLQDDVGYALDGQLQFGGSQLSLPEWGFTISDIHGSLDFDLDGLSAKGIRARTLGSPVQIDVTPLQDGTTRVRTSGNIRLKDIGEQVPAIPLRAASGRAEFVIDVDVPPAGTADGKPGILSVESDLKGVAIALPAPFGKTADQASPLRIRLPISEHQIPGSLSYAGQIDASFTNDGRRVDVVLGGDKAKPDPAPGIRIKGHLGTVDLFDWSEAMNTLPAADGNTLDTLDLDLRIDRIQADHLGINDLHLDARLDGGIWQGALEAPNLAGEFSAAQKITQRPIQIDLQRLHLNLPLGDADFQPAPIPDPEDGPAPSTLPELVLNIADLRINDANLGQLRFNAQQAPEGLHLTQFNLRGGQVEFDSAGHWSRVGARQETEWGGRLSTSDLGDLLVDLGYSRQVEKAASNLEFLLSWPGNPAQFHRATLVGSINLDVGAGRIVELDPGVTRVVGLLNLNALTRRLRLDFSDIYKKGYSFDSMQGDFQFADGTASTSNLSVLGPSGRIDLDGSADLMARTLDQHVTVTPNLDATLPIAGTLAGGPVAGVAVLVAQKLMNKQVDALNRFEYSLSGPWDQPEVRQLDSGGTLSKILRPLSGGEQQPAQTGEAPAPEAAQPAAPSDDRSAPEPATAAGDDTATAATEAPPEDQPAGSSNPLKGLIRFLRQSEPHGTDLPGTSE